MIIGKGESRIPLFHYIKPRYPLEKDKDSIYRVNFLFTDLKIYRSIETISHENKYFRGDFFRRERFSPS